MGSRGNLEDIDPRKDYARMTEKEPHYPEEQRKNGTTNKKSRVQRGLTKPVRYFAAEDIMFEDLLSAGYTFEEVKPDGPKANLRNHADLTTEPKTNDKAISEE